MQDMSDIQIPSVSLKKKIWSNFCLILTLGVFWQGVEGTLLNVLIHIICLNHKFFFSKTHTPISAKWPKHWPAGHGFIWLYPSPLFLLFKSIFFGRDFFLLKHFCFQNQQVKKNRFSGKDKVQFISEPFTKAKEHA